MIEDIKALTSMVYGLNIVTCKTGEKINGLTVAHAMTVTWNPPSLAIAINKNWYSHQLLSEGNYFNFHVLSDDQLELAKKFGSGSGRDMNKFEGVDWKLGRKGVPVINGCKAVMLCRKIGELRVGDTTIFIGQIVESEVDGSKKELVMDKRALIDSKYLA